MEGLYDLLTGGGDARRRSRSEDVGERRAATRLLDAKRHLDALYEEARAGGAGGMDRGLLPQPDRYTTAPSRRLSPGRAAQAEGGTPLMAP